MVYRGRVGDRKYKGGVKPNPPVCKSPDFQSWETKKTVICCRGCCTNRAPEDYPKVSKFDPDFYVTDLNGEKRCIFCWYCIAQLFERWTKKFGSPYKALYRICSLGCFVYDDELAHKVLEEEAVYEDGRPVSPYLPRVHLYLRALQDDDKYDGISMMDDNYSSLQGMISVQKTAQVEEKLSDQGKRDRAEIVEKFHYDPFENEPAIDRDRLYSDLLTLSDDAMSTDLVRQRAAIEIVKSFYRIDCIGLTIQKLQSTPESMVENAKVLKELIDQKTKETNMVTQFSRDHGFAERYQLAKSKGTGTLSSIVRDGFENHFDRMAVNKFDIETANAMQQVADISARAMLNQVQLTGDDFRDIVDTQATEIRNLQMKNEELMEANRILCENKLRDDLVEEYLKDLKKKGITDPEIIENALKRASQPTFFAKDGGDEE